MLYLILQTNSYQAIIVKIQAFKIWGVMFSNCYIQSFFIY